jgi:hypothetical protein
MSIESQQNQALDLCQLDAAPCSPDWVQAIMDAASLIRQGMDKLDRGPMLYYLENAAGSVEYLLGRFSPFKIGDTVELIETPEITEKIAWGWLGAKHYLKAGATGRVLSVDCDRKGLFFGVEIYNQTYIYDGKESPVTKPYGFCFRERWLRLANVQAHSLSPAPSDIADSVTPKEAR